MICSPLGSTSLFSIFHSTETFPGPVNKRHMEIAINSELVNIAACLSSGPHPAKP